MTLATGREQETYILVGVQQNLKFPEQPQDYRSLKPVKCLSPDPFEHTLNLLRYLECICVTELRTEKCSLKTLNGWLSHRSSNSDCAQRGQDFTDFKESMPTAGLQVLAPPFQGWKNCSYF